MPAGNWTQETPAGLPSARKYPAMAYDLGTNEVILFGGQSSVPAYLGDTHSWDGTLWTPEAPGASPSARLGHAMDSVLGTPYLFGGQDGVGFSDELWKWDGGAGNWVLQVPATTTPDSRVFAAIAEYVGAGLFMWGGNPTGATDELVWAWSIAVGDWQSFLPATRPEPRYKHTIIWDAARERVIMFGGVSLNTGLPLKDVWYWEHTAGDWFPLAVTTGPTERHSFNGMAYDPILKRFIFGPVGEMSQGGIKAINALRLNDGETFTLNDGINPVTVFEFNKATKPDDVNNLGPDVNMQFELTLLVGVADVTGASIVITCLLTSIEQTVVSYFSGGKNYADSTNLMGQSVPASLDINDYTVRTAVSAGNIEVDASTPGYSEADAPASAMRDRIIDAVDGVGAGLFINAVADPDDAAITKFYNDAPGEFGNVDILTTVVDPDFLVTGMSGVTPTTWSYDGRGNLWILQEPSVIPSSVDGPAVAWDGTREKIFMFGGSHTQVQHVWTWDTDGLSPYWSYPGVLQGRIMPVHARAQEGEYVFVLGADQDPLPSFMLDIGDEITLVQSVDLVGVNLLRFDWRMRYSPDMPQPSVLLNAGEADFKVVALVKDTTVEAPTGQDALLGVEVPASIFSKQHEDQLIDVAGSSVGANNGANFRLSCVPSGQGGTIVSGEDVLNVGYVDPTKPQGQIAAGRLAVIENAALAVAADSAVTLTLRGARWRAQAFIDVGSGDVLRAELAESLVQRNPNGWQRNEMAMHVSKVVSTATITFKLKLESTLP